MIPSAAELVAQLDQFVVGQAFAKRTLATAVSAHYRLAAYEGPTRIKKSNVLLLGPTGSGKTFLVQVIARTLGVPFHSHSATAITPSGWAGDDPETMIRQLVQEAKSRFAKEAWDRAKVGIVYLDEVDKLAARTQDQQGPGATGGFSIVQVQQALLKILEGTAVLVDGNPFPTDRVLFVGSGAFVGLEEVVRLRTSGGKAPHRGETPVPNILRQTLPQDLVQYGFIPEFAGRFPVSVALQVLSEDELLAILRDVQDSHLDQWNARLSVDGSAIEVEEVVLRNVARLALAQGTGARGLETAVWKLLEPVVYDVAPNTLVRIGQHGTSRETRPRTSSEADAFASAPDRSGEPAPEAARVDGTGVGA